ncbi:MAG TPA: ferredoxin [Pseudorhizobium sp.]|nr:ferredoxin [Pseudorhizobium sp.]
MSDSISLEELAVILGPSGLRLRGVASFGAGEGPLLGDGTNARSVALIGNIGGSIWPQFSQWRRGYRGPDPLDTWSKSIIRPLAASLGATAFFPSDRPYQPFQTWAALAEDLRPSPLGVLLHPRYGLWHGYRGALGFSCSIGAPRIVRLELPEGWEQICALACPVGAVHADGFDIAACRGYLGSEEGRATCMRFGCAARNACPIGADYRYPPAQLRFHMEALF